MKRKRKRFTEKKISQRERGRERGGRNIGIKRESAKDGERTRERE